MCYIVCHGIISPIFCFHFLRNYYVIFGCYATLCFLVHFHRVLHRELLCITCAHRDILCIENICALHRESVNY